MAMHEFQQRNRTSSGRPKVSPLRNYEAFSSVESRKKSRRSIRRFWKHGVGRNCLQEPPPQGLASRIRHFKNGQNRTHSAEKSTGYSPQLFLMCSGYMSRKTLHLRCSCGNLFLINIRNNDLRGWLRTCTMISICGKACLEYTLSWKRGNVHEPDWLPVHRQTLAEILL